MLKAIVVGAILGIVASTAPQIDAACRARAGRFFQRIGNRQPVEKARSIIRGTVRGNCANGSCAVP